MIAAASPQDPSSVGATGRALVPFVPVTRKAEPWLSLRAALLVGCCVVLGATGASVTLFRHVLPFGHPDQSVAAAATLHGLQDQVVRLQASVDALRGLAESQHAEEQLRGLKHSVEALKQDVEQVRTGATTTVAQLAARIDKTDHDPSQKLSDIAARLDRMERDGGKAEAQRVADLVSRVDRVEKQVSDPAATGSLPVTHVAPVVTAPGRVTAVLPPMPLKAAPAASATAAKPAVTSTVALHGQSAQTTVTQVPVTPMPVLPSANSTHPGMVAGWVLRDVYDGMALVQARSGGLREIQPGEYLPGAGEIRSIERHGRSWIVLTSRGVIADAAF